MNEISSSCGLLMNCMASDMTSFEHRSPRAPVMTRALEVFYIRFQTVQTAFRHPRHVHCPQVRLKRLQSFNAIVQVREVAFRVFRRHVLVRNSTT